MIGYARRRALRLVNTGLSALEARHAGEPPAAELLFIVGPPRSGTTLLYQMVVEAFDVGYLSNLHARFHGDPAAVQRMLPHRRFRGAPEYRSRFGETRGLLSPAEAGEYWYRFLPRLPHAVGAGELPAPQRLALRRSVRAFAASCARPVVFKNVVHSERIEALAEALPEARFVVVHRDPLDNAVSILRARRAVHGDEAPWFSVRPRSHATLAQRPPEAQVVGQVRAVHADIAASRALLGDDRFTDVHYGATCRHPDETLAALRRFMPSLRPRAGATKPTPTAPRHAEGADADRIRPLIEDDAAAAD